MTLTRIKVKRVNSKMEIVDKQNGIIDDNPVIYYGNEDSHITDDDISSGRVKHIGRGFTAFQEYINKNGHSKTEDPKVSISIQIPLSYVVRLRATGRGWQTRMSNYLIKEIKRGAFDNLPI